jgi:hypothetical protein
MNATIIVFKSIFETNEQMTNFIGDVVKRERMVF